MDKYEREYVSVGNKMRGMTWMEHGKAPIGASMDQMGQMALLCRANININTHEKTLGKHPKR